MSISFHDRRGITASRWWPFRTTRNYVLAEEDERSDVHMKMGIVTACRWHMNIKLRGQKKRSR